MSKPEAPTTYDLNHTLTTRKGEVMRDSALDRWWTLIGHAAQVEFYEQHTSKEYDRDDGQPLTVGEVAANALIAARERQSEEPKDVRKRAALQHRIDDIMEHGDGQMKLTSPMITTILDNIKEAYNDSVYMQCYLKFEGIWDAEGWENEPDEPITEEDE